MLRSLRARLFAFVAALAALAALGVGSATYFSVRAEADALFDYHLQQMALSLRDQGRIGADAAAALGHPEFDYVVQIWSVDGVALYTSRPPALAEPLPPRAVLGFSDVTIAGARWRVFAAATASSVVQVGQPHEVRQGLARGAAWRSVVPVALAAPLVALLLWWLLGISLAPLARVEAAVRERDVGTLQPLPGDGLPGELAPLVTAFNALLARLDAAFDAQRAFVADAAHELRSPLTALKLQLGLLKDARDEADRDAALQRLRAGVDRATHLVEQLLALARAEPGRHAPLAELDLAAVVRQAVADAGPLARTREAVVEVDVPETLPIVGDAQALRSLVRNLVDNALRHGAPDRPQVGVRLALDQGRPLLTVDDDGPGIAEEDRARVFDRFHRGAGRPSEGSGLGLAIVAAAARRHGASVRLEAAPLGGLRVAVAWG